MEGGVELRVKSEELRVKNLAWFLVCLMAIVACSSEKEHTAPAIYERDSVAMMTSYGVSTLISDSGVMKYRIVAERWEVNVVRRPSRWIFNKGIFLEQYDKKFHIEAYIQADTAYYYDERKLWELRGRVSIRTKDNLRFRSEELFWDQQAHEMYSHTFSRLVTPEREMEGTYFRSDEQMRHYIVTNSKGSFERGDSGFGNSAGDSILSAPDTTKAKLRNPTTPTRKK